MKLNYAVLGTNDLNSACEFYDALFKDADMTRLAPSDRMVYWLGDGYAFAVATPFDEKPASRGNGSMIGFDVATDNEVSRLYAQALELGGTCAGAPGQRGPKFSAYVQDLDGNKLCFAA